MEAVESMEMAPGVNPRPGRVPEQELLTPETWFLVAAELRNSSGEIVDCFRVFAAGGINRPKYDGQSRPWAPHHVPECQQVRPRHHMVWRGRGSPPSPLWTPCTCRENRRLGLVPCNSENISCETFPKRKTAKNRELALWHLVNRLVQ